MAGVTRRRHHPKLPSARAPIAGRGAFEVTKPFQLLDLFSGIGGFSLGLERSGGFKTVAFCEIEPFCRRVLAKHWPEVPCYDDIRLLTAERLAADGIAVDAICGGFPCQDISHAGRGAGLNGDRSGLWFEYARLIGELRPRYVIVENVAALLVRGLERVLGSLAEIGYDAEWHCIPASAVGAPHIRDRIWIVAQPQHTDADIPGSHRASLDQFGGVEFRDEQIGLLGSVCEDVANPVSVGLRGSGYSRAAGSTGSVQDQEQERQRVRPDASAGREDVADANCGHEHGRRGNVQVGRFGFAREVKNARDAGRTQWGTEPNVGGSLDGFSAWLDRSGLVGTEPHKLLLAYANASEDGPFETLRSLRRAVDAQCDERAVGGHDRICSEAVLFAYLRELSTQSEEQGDFQPSGAEAYQSSLRSVRGDKVITRPSCGPEHNKQRPGQHPDLMQAVSRLLARHAETSWLAYRRTDATAPVGWETGIARVAHGVPARVDRLRGLGNAVVPQIPELIGRAILAAEALR